MKRRTIIYNVSFRNSVFGLLKRRMCPFIENIIISMNKPWVEFNIRGKDEMCLNILSCHIPATYNINLGFHVIAPCFCHLLRDVVQKNG